MFNKSPNDPTDSSLSDSESTSVSDRYTCKDFDADEQMKHHLSQSMSSHASHETIPPMHHSTFVQHQQPLAYASMHELGYSDHLMELH